MTCGFNNNVMFASNADFTGTFPVSASHGLATDGQLWIGNTATGRPTVNTLTAGTGISISNGHGTITISVTSTAFTWQTITASQTLVKNNGYICISPGGALSLALPATAGSVIGDIIEVTLDGATSFTITQAAGQQIRISGSQTTLGAGGSLASTAVGDTIRMVYQASGRWNVLSSIGNFIVT